MRERDKEIFWKCRRHWMNNRGCVTERERERKRAMSTLRLDPPIFCTQMVRSNHLCYVGLSSLTLYLLKWECERMRERKRKRIKQWKYSRNWMRERLWEITRVGSNLKIDSADFCAQAVCFNHLWYVQLCLLTCDQIFLQKNTYGSFESTSIDRL